MNERILVVDDEEDILLISKRVLESKGYQVVTCEDGKKAMQAIEQAHASGKPFDLYLSDFQMPHMNGGELYLQIQASWLNGTAPFIILTGMEREDLLQAQEIYRPSQWVSKPIDPDKLVRIIEETLAHPRP